MEKERTLYNLAHEMDYQCGAISLNLETLNDIRTIAGKLCVDMDNVKPEDARFQFHEFFHHVRVIENLLRYTVNELNKNYDELDKTKETIFVEVVRQGESE